MHSISNQTHRDIIRVLQTFGKLTAGDKSVRSADTRRRAKLLIRKLEKYGTDKDNQTQILGRPENREIK